MDGKGLKAALKGLNWSQRRLARLLEVSPKTVNNWVRGRAAVPKCVSILFNLRSSFSELGKK